MLDTANPSDLLLIQIMTGLRHRYESLNRQYEEQLIEDKGQLASTLIPAIEECVQQNSRAQKKV
jgi:hypothetical protein